MKAMRVLQMFMAGAACVLAVGSACGKSSSPGSAPTAPAANASAPVPTIQPQCDQSLWAHVYDPTRLTIKQTCQTITGVLMEQHSNGDGDVDMRVAVDPQYANLLNDGNRAQLNGWLQTEAICQVRVEPDSPDAAKACGAFKGSVPVPPVGSHVQVTGTYVLDTHHGWMEIHPISVLEVR